MQSDAGLGRSAAHPMAGRILPKCVGLDEDGSCLPINIHVYGYVVLLWSVLDFCLLVQQFSTVV